MLVERLPFAAEWAAAEQPTTDVMDVRSRMAMYRLLVERTNPHGAFGGEHELSPFWGYASQLAWQHRSGRLGGTPNVIEPGSWWGACNYALSVVPYVAAMERGITPAIAIVAAPEFATALPAWHDALHAMLAPHDYDEVRLAIWRAHLISITLAVERHAGELAALPPAEQRFARGWVRMVDLFAAAGLRTDLAKLVESGGGALPSRILGDDGVELPRQEASAVRRIGALADRSPLRWRLELGVWRRMMRTRRARGESETLIAAMLGRGGWRMRGRALRYLR